jgi:hypothetical protein
MEAILFLMLHLLVLLQGVLLLWEVAAVAVGLLVRPLLVYQAALVVAQAGLIMV